MKDGISPATADYLRSISMNAWQSLVRARSQAWEVRAAQAQFLNEVNATVKALQALEELGVEVEDLKSWEPRKLPGSDNMWETLVLAMERGMNATYLADLITHQVMGEAG